MCLLEEKNDACRVESRLSENHDRMRWWDGQRWTSATKAASEARPPVSPASIPGAGPPRTLSEKARDRKRILVATGFAVTVLILFLGLRNVVTDIGVNYSASSATSSVRPSGAAIAQPYPKAAPPPPKSSEEIEASAAAQATADENARRRAESEAAAVFDRSTYPTTTDRDLALVSKNPDASRNRKIVVHGYVAQFDSVTGAGLFRADVGATPGSQYDYDLNVVVSGDAGILAPVAQGDYVTIYGVLMGSKTYENQFGGKTTAAAMTASIIDITG